jgi:hypothetical protein
MDTFNWKQYVLNYSDLQNKGIKTYKSAWKHYIMYGKNENRSDKNILLNVPYIIKGYLDLLKGTVKYHSEFEKGSSFEIQIPTKIIDNKIIKTSFIFPQSF